MPGVAMMSEPDVLIIAIATLVVAVTGALPAAGALFAARATKRQAEKSAELAAAAVIASSAARLAAEGNSETLNAIAAKVHDVAKAVEAVPAVPHHDDA